MGPYLQDQLLLHGFGGIALPRDRFLLSPKDEGPLVRRLNAVVPLSFAYTEGVLVGSCYGEALRETEACLRELCACGEPLFSPAALDRVEEGILPMLKRNGYRPSAFPHRYGYAFLAREGEAREAACDARVCRMTHAHLSLENRTSMKLSDCIARGAWGAVLDGAVVALCAVNGSGGGRVCTEIGVECAPAYRRGGLAAACVSALTEELLSAGHSVLYRCHSTNAASLAVVRKCGFREVGGFYTYTAFR